MPRLSLLLALVAALAAGPAAADIYKWTDEDGEVHYSDQPPPQDAADKPAGEAQVIKKNEDESDEKGADAQPRRGKIGTAWAIGPRQLVTNHHVIRGGKTIEIVLGKDRFVPVTVAETDPKHDLALLRVPEDVAAFEPLPVKTAPAAQGTTVLTMGYPHPDLMGKEPKLTKGIVSATSGFRGDDRLYQMQTPIQSGNSGGPLFNQSGQVVGVVVGKLSATMLAKRRNDVPQNVNYAVKSTYLGPWLGEGNVAVGDAEPLSTKKLAARVRDSIVMVLVR